MANAPVPSSPGNKVRRIITGCLLVLAIVCVGWIVSLTVSGRMVGSPPEAGAYVFFSFVALDILALLALGIWVLRPPVPGAIGFFGRWLGKVLLFLGLGVAIIAFFFATCLVVPALR